MEKTMNGKQKTDEKLSEIITRTDDFYNPVNQQRLRHSIDRLENGLGKVHELIAVDE